jgi:hypothetical protein
MKLVYAFILLKKTSLKIGLFTMNIEEQGLPLKLEQFHSII